MIVRDQLWGFYKSSWGFGFASRQSSATFATEVQSKKVCLMLKFFIEGGPIFMSVLTILLVGILFAAWKAPRWVKEIGNFALVFGFLSQLLGLLQMFEALQEIAAASKEQITGLFDFISPGVFFGGLKVSMIPVIYGIIIYLTSLVVRIIQKPRL